MKLKAITDLMKLQKEWEKIQNVRARENFRNVIEEEIQKIHNHDVDTKQEFKRLNTFIEANHLLIKTILYDSMLM